MALKLSGNLKQRSLLLLSEVGKHLAFVMGASFRLLRQMFKKIRLTMDWDDSLYNA